MDALLTAEGAVRRLHARYADALWRKDVDAFVDLYAEDAEWKVAGLRLHGHAAIRAALEPFMAGLDRTLMLFGDPIVQVENGCVGSRTMATENNRFADGRTATTIGIYYERLMEQDGAWRFTWRHWDLHYIGPPDFTAPLHAVKDYGAPPAMPAPDDPTTVQRSFLFTHTR